MPFTSENFDGLSVDDIVAKGGKTKKTLDKERQVCKILTEFVQDKRKITLEKLMEDKTDLESLLCEFFHCFRVRKGQKEEFPKRNTSEVYKSFIKMIILQKSDGKIDITDSVAFNKFNKYYQG